jgi:tetratricopeptide (TPR) repeat protein
VQISQSGYLARVVQWLPLVVGLGLLAPAAFAQGVNQPNVAAPSKTIPALCPSADQWSKVSAEQLAVWANACDENAFFHAYLGAQLLAIGQTEAAAVALEKALLINPDLPGAQLDFAQALAQIGLKGSARAILNDVLQRPDIQPALKNQLSKAQLVQAQPSWQWQALAQTAYGHESNLNSATYTDTLTLYLSNGPVTLGLSENAKPVSGDAFKTSLALNGTLRGLGSQELSVNVAVNSKSGAASVGGNNRTAEGALKYSLPVLAGNASGVWQLALGGTQFWLSSQTAYSDQGVHLKFNWDSLGAACKWAPSLGSIDQKFPQSPALNGTYAYARMDWVCSTSKNQETHLALSGGQDKAQDASRPGGNRTRADLILRHEQLVQMPVMPFIGNLSGQLTAWLRHANSKDKLPYSELLGDLKSDTKRTDFGFGYWVPVSKMWSAGLNIETTSQRSNNTLFNLKNSAFYAGIRWAQD